MTAPTALLVDWDGVLSGGRFWAARSACDPEFASCVQTLFGDQPLLRAWMTGHVPDLEVCARLGSSCGVPADHLMDELRASCQAMPINEPLLDLLTTLNVRLIVATDNMPVASQVIAERQPIAAVFESVISSTDTGALKRDGEAFFTAPLAHMGLDPSRCALLDDNPTNCQAFRLLGGAAVDMTHVDCHRHILELFTPRR